MDKNWLKLGLSHVFVLLLVTKSSKTPSFSLNLWHLEDKILRHFLQSFLLNCWLQPARWQLLGQSVLLRRTTSGAMSPAPLQTVLRSCFWPAGMFVRAALSAGVQGVFTQQSHEVDSRGCSSFMFHWIHGHHWLFGLVAWFSLRVREVLGSIPRTALLPVWFHGAARAQGGMI